MHAVQTMSLIIMVGLIRSSIRSLLFLTSCLGRKTQQPRKCSTPVHGNDCAGKDLTLTVCQTPGDRKHRLDT
jgi:hypothetical protein